MLKCPPPRKIRSHITVEMAQPTNKQEFPDIFVFVSWCRARSKALTVKKEESSNWACHPKKNLKFPDWSSSPVAFQLDLPPKSLEFPDCSVIFQLSLRAKSSSSQIAVVDLSPSNWAHHQNLRFPDCSCGPVAFQIGPATKKCSSFHCSCSPVAFQPPKNLELPDCSCALFQLDLPFPD